MELEREWIEAVPEDGAGRIELVPLDTVLPPARMPRRRLDLRGGGQGAGRVPGPADATLAGPAGGWRRQGDVLELAVPGWEGRYRLERCAPDRLILQRL